MPFPRTRMRRLRANAALRRMTAETQISRDNLIMPLFVRPGTGVKKEIPSMPGNYQWSPDTLADEAKALEDLGIPGVILFGIPEHKDAHGSEADAPDSVVCRAIEAIKKRCASLCVITDVCLCEYTDHGHCGIIAPNRTGVPEVDNDATLPRLVSEALTHARAGADIVAPSDMMDGRVGAIREALDREGFTDTPIMAYSAKYASAFYGPFRDAAESPPQFGDRRSYQMDPPNTDEAMREIALDIEEGADLVMVKPAMAYLDILRRASDRFDIPLAAYNVSGEFSAIKAAALQGWLDERAAAEELLTAIRRAGAQLILTYWAKDYARWNR